MKDYENIEALAGLVREYRLAKRKEKNCTVDSDKISAKLLEESGMSEEEIKNIMATYSYVQSIVEQMTSQFKAEKKQLKTMQEYLLEKIENLFLNDYKEEEKVEDKVKLPSIATISFEKKKELRFSMTEDKKTEIIEALVEQGMTDMLTIDEKAYLEFAQQMKEQEIDVAGVTEIETSKVSIRCS